MPTAAPPVLYLAAAAAIVLFLLLPSPLPLLSWSGAARRNDTPTVTHYLRTFTGRLTDLTTILQCMYESCIEFIPLYRTLHPGRTKLTLFHRHEHWTHVHRLVSVIHPRQAQGPIPVNRDSISDPMAEKAREIPATVSEPLLIPRSVEPKHPRPGRPVNPPISG
ncbi:hypothetical protein B0T10DRAFT_464414 [Thelonectria olida]|uniref:Uncharacterized protein n=1 Tax=Thelonectria olida TaxID=1576542 RepID=A0A9P9AKT5_9HYPO|nr:hypothetical protein B0T10DRAFT_464414 [Thelonectria olida]